MVVSLIAFVCTAIMIIIFTRVQKLDTVSFEFLAPFILVCSLILPVVIKAYAYSNLFRFDRNENNFNASYVINLYNLTGWIKGKYTFLEASGEACNGNCERGFELYVDCLGDAEDKRLRRACYKDMVRHLSGMDNSVRLVPYIIRGCEEFPNERDLFEWVASYYIWYKYADENEALEWFGKVTENTKDDTIKARAHFYTGLSSLYNKRYEQAESSFDAAYALFSPLPCYLCIDMAVCKGCLGKYDEAREYALQAVALTDDQTDVDYISEKITYLFKAKTENVNPEVEKLIDELKRRRVNDLEDAVHISDIEKYNSAVEKAKEMQG